MAWLKLITKDLPTLDAITKPWAKADPECKELLGQVRMHVWRGAEALVVQDASGLDPLHIHVGSVASKRRGAWGVYYNFLVAYTPPEERRHGLARWALKEMTRFRHGIEIDRIKSLAGSKLGVLLHAGLGHHMWGATDKGELQVDTPVREGQEFPDTYPSLARAVINKNLAEGDWDDMRGVRPMNLKELKAFFKQRYNEAWPRARTTPRVG